MNGAEEGTRNKGRNIEERKEGNLLVIGKIILEHEIENGGTKIRRQKRIGTVKRMQGKTDHRNFCDGLTPLHVV